MITTITQLVYLVNEIQLSVSGVSNLNSGGCGVFAAMVAKRLNRIGVPAVVRVGSYHAEFHPDKMNDALNEVTGKRNVHKSDFEPHIGFDHLIVEINFNGEVYHLDSDYFHEARSYTENYGVKIYNGALDALTALRIASSKYWNPCFDRGQIPYMIKALNGVFAKYANA